MKKVWLAALSLVGVATCSFLAGSLYERRPATKPSAVPPRTVPHYRDAMNPSYTSHEPGKAPDGMELQPAYADEPSSTQHLMPAPGSGAAPRRLERPQA